MRLRSSLLILFVCSCSCSCSVVNYSCWLYFCHFVSFVSFVTSFVSFVSLYSILFCYPFLLLLLLFSLSLLCGMLQPPVAIFFNLLENVGEGRVKRKRKIRWDGKKRSSTRGCGGWVKRTKMRVGSERKRRTEFQSEFQLLPVTPSDEVVKFAAAAAAASKSHFDKHLFSGPIIFFPLPLFDLSRVPLFLCCAIKSGRVKREEREEEWKK